MSLEMSSIRSFQYESSPHGEDQVDEDGDNEIIMAIDMKDNNTIGCAYYIMYDETLCLQEDIPMAGIEIIETLLLQAEPTTVIINNRAPSKMTDFLESHAQDVDRSQVPGMLQGVYILRTVGTADFKPDKGREKLANLDEQIFGVQSTILSDAAGGGDELEIDGDSAMQSKLMRLSTLINLDSHLSIGCAGAVMNELQRRRVVQYLPDDPEGEQAFCIKSITMFTLGNSMFVNADALISLQILGSEQHPNAQQAPDKAKTGAKEDLSVYGLVKSLAVTSQGKTHLRQLFLRPSNDLDLIAERHRTIAAFLRPDNAAVMVDIKKSLGRIKDLKTTISNLTKGVHQTNRMQGVKNGVWLTLLRFAHASIELAGLVHNLAAGRTLDILAKISNIDTRSIHNIGEMISHHIDFEHSSEAQRSTVKWGVDPELDQLKNLFAGLEDILAQVRMKLLQIMPEWARVHLVNCIFYPQLGFLVAVVLNPETGQGAYHGQGLNNDNWVKMFTNEGLVLYKTRMMEDLDQTYGDPYGQLVDKEIEIVHELGVRVLRSSATLVAASELYGKLDGLMALSLAAVQYHWTAPEMTVSNMIDIRKGRHPLQELVVPAFIANPCHLSGGVGVEEDEDISMPDVKRSIPSMLIMTGPNHSGKSIYLKQVALIVFLAHVGSYVPADHAVIGLTDKILTRISTRESMAQSESAFAIDLRQAAFAINHVTHRSLVLVDEFGKGTNPNDGAGLMTALLAHFRALQDARPKVLVATHFHEIFENGFIGEDDEHMTFAHMDVRTDFDAVEPDDQLTYLFRLVLGRSTSSFGTQCASRNGVSKAIVERAEDLTLMLARNEDLRTACAKLAPAEEKRLEEAEGIARLFVEMDLPDPKQVRLDGPTVRGMLGVLLGADDSS